MINNGLVTSTNWSHFFRAILSVSGHGTWGFAEGGGEDRERALCFSFSPSQL